ncbi:cytochrome P450 [Aquihabitans sp. McL0605]|uniref:cytochrome P450 n=1 Tax=Aquihabitans sp. McL0605 TaxID=3415671 RepID=UPI003CF0D16F
MPETAVEFDPFSSEYFDDPTETYRRLREEAPVYFSERYGFYALSRFDDLVAAHRDWKGLSSAHGVDLSTLSLDPDLVKMLGMIIMMDPPEHDRFRALVSRVFTPRAMAAFEPMIRGVIVDLLDPLADRPFDAVAEFAALFPVEIISRMLGVPEGERQQIRHWLDLSLHREPGEMEMTAEGQNAMLSLVVYFQDLAKAKREHPDDDMLTRLTEVTIDRGDGEQTQLTNGEIAGFAALLGGAGAETVTKLVANAVVLFDQHPDQWKKVVADPERIPAAVEEILRIHPPSQYQGRFSVEERTYEGGTIPAGFPVLLLTGAATRDARTFDRPDEFDIDRQQAVAIGFGHGVHSCLGAALARMESRIAIEEITKRWTRLEVDRSGLRRVSMSNVAGYSSVPVTPVR